MAFAIFGLGLFLAGMTFVNAPVAQGATQPVARAHW
jgi:hypothetical protein